MAEGKPEGARKGAPNPYVLDLVRRQDRDRFVTALFAPAAHRDRLLAFYALNIELARIPPTVSEPMLGQIKLQWWRDLVERLAKGEPPPIGHPVSEALAAIPRLDRAQLVALIDAREPELAGAERMSIVEPIGAALVSLALGALEVDDAATMTAARDAAIALGLATLAAEKFDEAIIAHAHDHIAAARANMRVSDKRAIPVLLWATVAEAKLRRPRGPLPMLRLAWNAWRGRY